MFCIQIMKMMAARRKQLSQSGKTEIPAPAPPPPHPGYAPDAALHAIKRHALEFVNPKELQVRTYMYIYSLYSSSQNNNSLKVVHSLTQL